MKLLLVSPWFPWPPHNGGRIRIYETNSLLSPPSSGHPLASTSSREAPGVGPLNELCERIETTVHSYQPGPILRRLAIALITGRPLAPTVYYDQNLAKQLVAMTTKERYDIVQIEFSYVARYAQEITQGRRSKKYCQCTISKRDDLPGNCSLPSARTDNSL